MNKAKKITILAITIFFSIAPVFLARQTVLAGQMGCQTGEPVGTPRPPFEGFQQKKFAAAQTKYSDEQPPSAGILTGSDSDSRSNFSYFASVIFIFGAIWLLISLLREHWLKRCAPRSAKVDKVWNFALNPSFALSVFAILFAVVIVGSVLTSPPAASAQKREKTERTKAEKDSANLGLPRYQPVFKSAQQIGGDGVTQIGVPVFDSDGNRYVRGAFSGNLTIGKTTLTATSDFDLFIAKYDVKLNPVWVRQGSGITNAPFENIAVEGASAMGIFESIDEGGYIYVAGSFVKMLTLQGGANPQITLTDNGGPGFNYESFLAKYDTDGNLIWARGGNSGSPQNTNNLEIGQNAINKIVFDKDGNPYVAGLISGSNFLGASISGFICSSNQNCSLHGKTDILLAKLDKTTGAPTRMHILGGNDNDNGLDLAIDNITSPNNPKLYLIGNFSSPQIYLPNSIGGQTYTNTEGSINSFGYYLFEEIATGGSYLISVSHKRYAFSDISQILTVTQERTDLDFIGN